MHLCAHHIVCVCASESIIAPQYTHSYQTVSDCCWDKILFAIYSLTSIAHMMIYIYSRYATGYVYHMILKHIYFNHLKMCVHRDRETERERLSLCTYCLTYTLILTIAQPKFSQANWQFYLQAHFFLLILQSLVFVLSISLCVCSFHHNIYIFIYIFHLNWIERLG